MFYFKVMKFIEANFHNKKFNKTFVTVKFRINRKDMV
jgi:hypothetical protein